MRGLFLSRCTVSIAGLLAFAVVGVAYLRAPALFADITKLMLAWPPQWPFADWSLDLAWIKCWSEGVNVYLENTCRPEWQNGNFVGFNYSPLWLRFSFLRFDLEWITATSLSIIALFYLSLATLPPARRPRDQIIVLFAAISSGTFLGLENLNVDVIFFLFIVATLNLRLLALPYRLIGYALIVLAGLLKFYPFIGMIVVLRERVKIFIAVALASVAALAALVLTFHQEMALVVRGLPKPNYFNLQFGMADLPVVLGVTTANILRNALHEDAAAARAAGEVVARWSPPCLIVIAAALAFVIARRCRLPERLARFSERDIGYLVMGAALTAGCFFAFNSHLYRGMFLLFSLPGMAALSRWVPAPLGNRVFGTASFAVPFVLWKPFLDMCLGVASHWQSARVKFNDPYDAFPGLTPDYLLWLAYELAWWWIVSVLLAILGSFVVRSDAWALLCRIPRAPNTVPAGGELSGPR